MTQNLWKLQAIRFLFWLHFVAAVLVPFFTDWAGLSLSQVFLLNAWFMFWNFALEVPTGAVADMFGRKWSLALGCTTIGAGALLYVSAPVLGRFLVAEVLFAIAHTLCSGADEALAFDSLAALGREGDLRRLLARMESWKLAGLVLGALSGSLIAARYGLRAPLAAQALPAVVAAGIACTLREPTVAAARGGRAYVQLLLQGMRQLRRTPALRVLAFDAIGVGAIAWTLIWLYQPLLTAAGVAVGWFGVVHAVLCLGQIGVLQSIDRLERLVGSRRAWLRVSAVVAGVAFVALGWLHAVPAVLGTIIVAQSVGLSRTPLFVAYMNAHIGSAERATVLSTVSMLRTLAICLVNPVAGFLADRSLSTTMLVLGTLMLLLTAVSRVEDTHLAA